MVHCALIFFVFNFVVGKGGAATPTTGVAASPST